MHDSDVRMSTMASQITGISIVCSTADQAQIKENIKAPRHQHLWGEFEGYSPLNGEFPAQRANNAEMFPFDDIICFSHYQAHQTISLLKSKDMQYICRLAKSCS